MNPNLRLLRKVWFEIFVVAAFAFALGMYLFAQDTPICWGDNCLAYNTANAQDNVPAPVVPYPGQTTSIAPTFNPFTDSDITFRFDCQNQAKTGHSIYIEIIRKNGTWFRLDICELIEVPRLVP